MASIRREILVARPREVVWGAFRDVGAVHERLLPGRVRGVRIEGDVRMLELTSGHAVRELIVDVDDARCRLAYAVVASAMPLDFHHAAFELAEEGREATRVVWVTDVLPHAAAQAVAPRMEAGLREMRAAIEAAEA